MLLFVSQSGCSSSANGGPRLINPRLSPVRFPLLKSTGTISDGVGSRNMTSLAGEIIILGLGLVVLFNAQCSRITIPRPPSRWLHFALKLWLLKQDPLMYCSE